MVSAHGVRRIARLCLGAGSETPYRLSQATLAVALLLVLWLYPDEPELAFNETFVNDRMATVLKAVILAVTAGVFVYSRAYLAARALFNGEYFVLGLFAVLGMLILVSAHSLLTIYLKPSYCRSPSMRW